MILRPRQTAHCIALHSSSWEKSSLFYAGLKIFFPIVSKAIIIHSHKRILFCQCDNSLFHFCKALSS